MRIPAIIAIVALAASETLGAQSARAVRGSADPLTEARTEVQRLRRQNDSLRAVAAAAPLGTASLVSLKNERLRVQGEIREASAKNDSLAGGLVKAFVEARLAILHSTSALLTQRIVAIGSGARVLLEASGTRPDTALASSLAGEIAAQEVAIRSARQEAAQYSGGLVLAMKQSTIATQEQTLAMLRQRYLTTKYGLPQLAAPVSSATPASSPSDRRPRAATTRTLAEQILQAKIRSKRFSEQEYQEYVFFDIEFIAEGLDKPARAIKGTLDLQDLFGESKFTIGWTIEQPVQPGASFVEDGSGFKFNQFISAHQWVRSTTVENMKAVFRVQSILFTDGTRRDY